MQLNVREWINDIIVGSLTGLLAGAVGALFILDPPFVIATIAGSVIGLIIGLLSQPLRWLLNTRRDHRGGGDSGHAAS
jgi:hypothetical protein